MASMRLHNTLHPRHPRPVPVRAQKTFDRRMKVITWAAVCFAFLCVLGLIP
jgi:hypothetical protein